MVQGGNATVMVADMDRSIRFYTEVLGLKLVERYGADWATVSAGEGLLIGIHPVSAEYPAPGTKGSVVLGLVLDCTAEEAVARLLEHGVETKRGVVSGDAGRFVGLDDVDGNALYLWEKR